MLDESFKFYYKAIKFKEMLRSGPIVWRVNKDRIESIAEHTFGCMILAISLYSQLKLEMDLGKVLEMLAIHELEELAIGDITPLDKVNKEDLIDTARKSVEELVEKLEYKDELMRLTDEFNYSKSIEAKFAKAIDKLECVLEFKRYHDNGQVSVDHVTDEMLENERLKAYIDTGEYDIADIFFLFHLKAYEEFGVDEDYWFNYLKDLKIYDYK